MNKIYWDKEKIAILTDQIEAQFHKHWAIQIFISLDEDTELFVSDTQIIFNLAVVNQNVFHRLSSRSKDHFSIIIHPTSSISKQLSTLMQGNDYYACEMDLCEIKSHINQLKEYQNLESYHYIINEIYRILGLNEIDIIYDERVLKVLNEIENCHCQSHIISTYARVVSLSPSRLSHLFKEQVGLPLKSYTQYHQMKKAFLLLLKGKSITEAAMIANFDSPSHFAYVTKKMMGIPASISTKNSVFLKVSS